MSPSPGNDVELNAAQRSARVVFKSPALTGIMAEQYFNLAVPEHFWCRRRFEVLRRLADPCIRSATTIAEIGCGNGVLQRQIEDAYGISPAGFDLHEDALRHNMCRRGSVYCYDIHDRAPEFQEAFDLILMFDVLEHIEDQDRFLESTKFHLRQGGFLAINVPALQWLYSPYDRIQGHQRRYSIATLERVARRNGFSVTASTYWGGPLVPVLALRKITLTLGRAKLDNYSTGFDPRGELVNKGLYGLSRCELVPQRIAGTSVMALLRLS